MPPSLNLCFTREANGWVEKFLGGEKLRNWEARFLAGDVLRHGCHILQHFSNLNVYVKPGGGQGSG